MDNPRHNTRDIFPATGTEITAKSWLTEAPMRMLMNNLHPDVAENPHELVVYGGIGRAARTWKDFDLIVDSLKKLEDDQTLLEWTRAHGSITRRDVMALLNLSDTAAYLPHHRCSAYLFICQGGAAGRPLVFEEGWSSGRGGERPSSEGSPSPIPYPFPCPTRRIRLP